jgi:hypothetical protein
MFSLNTNQLLTIWLLILALSLLQFFFSAKRMPCVFLPVPLAQSHMPWLLLYKLAAYRLSAGYVNWFSSYLTNKLSHVRYSVALLSLFEVSSDVSQEFVRTIVI